MKILKFAMIPLSAAVAALAMSGTANALSIGFDNGSDGTYEVIVNDGDGNDSNPLANAVTFIGTIGIWTVNVGTGISTATGTLDLNDVSQSSGAGSLTVSVWEQFTGVGAVDLNATIGGTTDGTVDVTFSEYAAGSTVPPPPVAGALSTASLGTFNPIAFSGATVLSNAGLVDFDLGIDVEINHAKAGLTSFDANLHPVPIPAAGLLFGSALIGSVVVGRRRKRCEKEMTAA